LNTIAALAVRFLRSGKEWERGTIPGSANTAGETRSKESFPLLIRRKTLGPEVRLAAGARNVAGNLPVHPEDLAGEISRAAKTPEKTYID